MVENFPKLIKDVKLLIQAALRAASKRSTKNNNKNLILITVELTQTKDKEKNIKCSQRWGEKLSKEQQ